MERLRAEAAKRERARRQRAQERSPPHPKCSKLAQLELAWALWGTKALAARERSFAQAWMTRKVEILPGRVQQAAKAQELPAGRWLPEQALTRGPMQRTRTRQKLQKRRIEPTELLAQEPT